MTIMKQTGFCLVAVPMVLSVACSAQTGQDAVLPDNQNQATTEPVPDTAVQAEQAATTEPVAEPAASSPEQTTTSSSAVQEVDVVQTSHCGGIEPVETGEWSASGTMVELVAGTYNFRNTAESGNADITSIDHPDDDFVIGYARLSAGETRTETIGGGRYAADFGRDGNPVSWTLLKSADN